MTRDQQLNLAGFRWTRPKHKRTGVIHLARGGVAVCGCRVDLRDVTPFLGGWGNLCKKCVKISGAGR